MLLTAGETRGGSAWHSGLTLLRQTCKVFETLQVSPLAAETPCSLPGK